jgi:hypothetical protein
VFLEKSFEAFAFRHVQKSTCAATRTDGICESCVEDEGRPLGIGFQELVSNQSKLLRLGLN